MLSAITVCGTPCWPSSQAVSEAPWLRGRVSSTQTWTRNAGVVRHVDRRGRGAPIDRREPAGVAVGEHVHRLAASCARRSSSISLSPCRPIAWLIATSSSADLGGAPRRPRRRASSRGWLRTAADHLVERPAQIDRGRPRRGEHGAGALEIFVGGVGAQREAQAVGRRRPDQRRAAHLHATDRVRGLVKRREPQGREAVRQHGLIDDADRPAVRLEPDAAGLPCR